MVANRIGLENLAKMGTTVQIPGVRWHEYTFNLDGDEDARLEAEALFAKQRKAEWIVIRDAAGRFWVFKRGETQPAVAPIVRDVSSHPPLRGSGAPILALPPPAAVDVPAQVVGPAVKGAAAFVAYVRVRALRRLLTLIKPLASEVRLIVDKTGCTVTTVDQAHVAILHAELGRPDFETSESTGPADVFVDVDRWLEVLKLPDRRDSISLGYAEFADRTRVGFKFDHIQRFMEGQKTARDGVCIPQIPRLDPSACEYAADAGALLDSVRQAQTYADHVALVGSSDGLRAKAEGDVTTGETVLSDSGSGDAKSLYPLWNAGIGDFAKALKGATEPLTLRFKNDYPLKLSFQVDGVNGFYLLAPRVEDD